MKISAIVLVLSLIFGATSPTLAQTAYGPYKVELIDMVGNSCPDMVLGYHGAGVVTIELGDCSNGLVRNYGVTAYTTGSAVGDRHIHNMAFAEVDGDGKIDAAFAIGQGAGAIVVARNLGNGTLPQQWTSGPPPSGYYFKAVALGDFDGDGNTDLAGALRASSGADAFLYLWPGLGGFSFGSPTVVSTGSAAYDIDLADFNGDGHTDFLIPADSSTYAALFLNPGSTIFSSPPSYSAITMPTPPGYIAPRINDARAIDMNADGFKDIVLLSTNGGLLAVFHGDGTGAFAYPQMWQAVAPAVTIADCDMNADGLPDLAVTTYIGANATSVLVNSAGGLFPRQVLATDTGSYGVACENLGGWSAPEIITANYSSRTINFVAGVGGGLFNTPVSLPRGIKWNGTAWVAE